MATPKALLGPTPNLEALAELVWGDLDPQRYGLTWMEAPTAMRVLLSDHLAGALESVGSGLNDATFHLDAYKEASGSLERSALIQLRRSWEKGGGLQLAPSASRSVDRLYLACDTSISGFFRACGSVLDNLGVAAAVLGAVEVDVVAGFTWHGLVDAAAGTAPDLDPRPALSEVASDAGPPGWLPWTLDVRDMVVHGPRRLWLTRVVADPGRGGRPLRAHHRLLLPRQPGLTTIEMMRGYQSLERALLSEPAEVTMRGVLASARALVDGACGILGDLYRLRKERASDVTQPAVQWRCGHIQPFAPPATFDGYEAGSVALSGDEAPSDLHPALVQRLRAGGVLDGDGAGRWTEWLTNAQGDPQSP